MTGVSPRPTLLRISVAPATGLLAVAGCSSLETPTGSSIMGVPPSGIVSVTEEFVTRVGGGTGTLTFQRQDHPFRPIGAVVGPGGGLSKMIASGEVYKLAEHWLGGSEHSRRQ
jgi:hypothetical protein